MVIPYFVITTKIAIMAGLCWTVLFIFFLPDKSDLL